MILWKYLVKICRDLWNPQNVHECYRLLFMVTFLFGLVPYNMGYAPENEQLFPSLLSSFNILACIVGHGFCFAYNFLYEPSVVNIFFRSNLSFTTASLQKFNGMFALTFLLLACLLRKKSIQRLIVQYSHLEKRFLNVGVIFKQFNVAIRINFVVFLLIGSNILFTYQTLYLILRKHGVKITFSTAISFYSPSFIVCGVTMLFCGTLYKISSYLNAMNKVLKNLGKQWEKNSVKTIPPKQRSLQCLDSFSMYTIVTKNNSEIVQESMEIHQLICEAANTANKYFTYQLLTIISIAFLIIVFDAYYVLETLLGKSKRESKFKTVEFVTFFSCQMILYLIAIISIVEGSNRAIKKSEKTGGIVHALLNKVKDIEIKEKLQQFSMQLMHLKINFTAAGLFNIDRTLYFTISGALTTYLIILLQFTSTSSSTNSTNGTTGAI